MRVTAPAEAAQPASRQAARQMRMAADLLKSQSTLALSTVAEDGGPCLAPLFYLPGEGLRLYWFSASSSQHSRNLERDAAAAVAVYRPAEDWRKIRGVQMRGRVSAVKDKARREAITKAYIERFRLGTLFGAAISRSRLYEFQPAWLRYLDNSRRFGYKFEMSLTCVPAGDPG